MEVITSILVPTDLGPESDRALAYACELADELGASLHVLHVVEDPFAAGAFMEMYTPPPAGYVEWIARAAEARLETLLTSEQRAKYGAVTVTRIGAPARQILEHVRANPEIGVIVMATAGRGGVARLMMGSVADKVVRSAPCPVLTLHRHDHLDAGSEHRAA